MPTVKRKHDEASPEAYRDFERRVTALIDRYRLQLEKLRKEGWGLRTVRVGKTDVRAHTRGAYRRTIVARLK